MSHKTDDDECISYWKRHKKYLQSKEYCKWEDGYVITINNAAQSFSNVGIWLNYSEKKFNDYRNDIETLKNWIRENLFKNDDNKY